ncbi:MAG: hypothetical protein KGL39_17805, partial [Patescibacteria group bacterium]|nr:hypothetical protein [Patescibacteria group bacterium]
QMNWMHEKFLRYGNGKDRKYFPGTLKLFNENIESAMRKYKNGGQFDEAERSDSRWRARCKAWMKNPNLWQENQWGSAPNTLTTRVPKTIIKELGITAQT